VAHSARRGAPERAQRAALRALGAGELAALAARLAGPSLRHSLAIANVFDAYHYPTHGSPDAALPYARIALQDEEQTTYYVDPARARLLAMHTTRTRLARWLFQGLHCIDLPPLYEQRVLWRTLMIGAMALGGALSGLGLLMTWRRWRRAARRRGRRRVATGALLPGTRAAAVVRAPEQPERS